MIMTFDKFEISIKAF